MPKAAFHNLGCKVNATELETVMEQFRRAGYELVPFDEPADVYVVNTCTVTNIADRKSRQMLHRARRENPQAVVAAMGCYVQNEKKNEQTSRLAEDGIDLAVGNDHKGELLALVEEALAARAASPSGTPAFTERITDLTRKTPFEELGSARVRTHTRAFVKIEDGCNQFCSYCAIPYARGRVRSRDPQAIVEEVRALAAQGAKEIVFAGIHISSYGTDFVPPERRRTDIPFYGEPGLADLADMVAAVPGIERIRLGSLEPRILTEAFVKQIAANPKVCPQFHLSLQSGCTETLRRMNRHYTAKEFAEGCRLLRAYYDDPALTTDVIAGFPGETKEEFAATRAFVKEIGFARMHIFPFSLRKGTAAERLPDHVSTKDKTVRAALLADENRKLAAAYEERHLGKEAEWLAEETVTLDGRVMTVGCTREYLRAAVPGTIAPNTVICGVLKEQVADGESGLLLLRSGMDEI